MLSSISGASFEAENRIHFSLTWPCGSLTRTFGSLTWPYGSLTQAFGSETFARARCEEVDTGSSHKNVRHH
jgi:hypothetical protein